MGEIDGPTGGAERTNKTASALAGLVEKGTEASKRCNIYEASELAKIKQLKDLISKLYDNINRNRGLAADKYRLLMRQFIQIEETHPPSLPFADRLRLAINVAAPLALQEADDETTQAVYGELEGLAKAAPNSPVAVELSGKEPSSARTSFVGRLVQPPRLILEPWREHVKNDTDSFQIIAAVRPIGAEEPIEVKADLFNLFSEMKAPGHGLPREPRFFVGEEAMAAYLEKFPQSDDLRADLGKLGVEWSASI